ncbi:hypothetical protein AAOE16_18140 [Ekhidna sp. MALMAid0563]|uniref:hypothetical protein n=1 Tax=Ekhidna sp. MALMAid0563 TaxID=3143937 RepID=UPI0032DF18C2
MKRYATLSIEITKMISAFMIATGVAYNQADPASSSGVAIYNILIVETAAFVVALTTSVVLTIFNR